MFKIPINSIFSQTNKSDLFGNIFYTKSINFDEPGYLKLSSRSVSLINSENDNDFNLPVSFGRVSEGDFYIGTTENPYILDLNDGASSLIKDTDNGGATPPTLAFGTYGKWWRGLWHVTNNTKLYYKTVSNGDWTDSGIALTTGISHPIESFDKANTLMVGNGNLIKQLDSSYATGTLAQLTIPSDYEIIGLAYNNNLLGIATRLSSTVLGENIEAKLFIWDGSASSANASYGVGSDTIIQIIPYKSSFAILTRTGELKYFNGGGFESLASFPAYFLNAIWATFLNKPGFGDILKVDGEKIYINVLSTIIDMKLNTYVENQLGGVWCYDPDIGLYHTQAPSISQASILACQSSGVDITNNKITVYNSFSYPSSPTIPPTGSPVKVIGSTIGGIVEGTMYYIIKSSATEFKLATSKENALALTAIDLTSVGGSFSYFMTIDVKDYGLSRNTRTAGVSLMGSIRYVYDKLIFGGDYYDSNSTVNTYAHLNISVAGFKNIGYFVTCKMPSSNVEDNYQKLYIKYRPLATDDSIIIKYKNKDVINLPEYADCTVTSSTVLTTTSNIADSLAYTDELECEILSGAGAGQMSKITSITYNAGTYTITLEDEMDGLSASDTCFIKIDNWTYIETIGESDVNSNNYKEISLAKNSKWFKFKIVLQGSEVTIEEMQIISIPEVESL